MTINAHRHFTLRRKSGRKKEELEIGELVRRVLVQGRERGEEGGGGRGRQECVGGVEVKREEGRELKSKTWYRISD